MITQALIIYLFLIKKTILGVFPFQIQNKEEEEFEDDSLKRQ